MRVYAGCYSDQDPAPTLLVSCAGYYAARRNNGRVGSRLGGGQRVNSRGDRLGGAAVAEVGRLADCHVLHGYVAAW